MLLTALFSAALVTLPVMAAPALPSVDIGEPVPLFLLPAVNEDAAVRAVARPQVELADLVGVSPRTPAKAVVLYFFDRQHGADGIAQLSRVQKQVQGKGVQVLAISADTGELAPLAAWLDKQKVPFPVLRDEHGVVRSRYGITDASLPLTLIVESSGRLFAVGQPGPAELESSVAAELQPLIK
jgi:peroxiredoxin